MGFAMGMGTCGSCNKLFSFNPRLVPSVRHDGQQLVFCQECCGKANVERAKNNLPLIPMNKKAWQPVAEEEL